MEGPIARQRTEHLAADGAWQGAQDRFGRAPQQQQWWRQDLQRHVLQHVGPEEDVGEPVQR